MRPPNRTALVPRLITDLHYKNVQEDVMDCWDQNLMDAEHCPEIKALYEGQITSTLQCRHCSSSCNVATERFHTLHLPIIGTTGKLFRTVSAALQAYESLPSVPSHVQSMAMRQQRMSSAGITPRHTTPHSTCQPLSHCSDASSHALERHRATLAYSGGMRDTLTCKRRALQVVQHNLP